MRHILTIEQMKATDNFAIKRLNISGAILMENAARSSVDYIIEIMDELGFNERNPCNDPMIDIICGSGNNGGDGFAIARHLHELFKVRVFWIGVQRKMSPETLNNFKAIDKLQIESRHIKTASDLRKISFSQDCIIDSMIGVGGSENIKGIALDILKELKKYNSLKIAIDAPAGLNTNTGFASPYCFNADFTITMFAEKIGMFLNEGPDVCGTILRAYLGVPENIITEFSKVHILEQQDIANLFPLRKRISSKFDYGRILVVAGSKKYPGAAALCANTAIISGAGLVHLHSTAIHHSLLAEIIPMVLPATNTGSLSVNAFNEIKSEAEKSNVLAIGPGLSDDAETISLVNKLLKEFLGKKRIILDADGLKAINGTGKLNKNIILTPHIGEFSNITGIPRKEIEKDSLNLAKEWAKKLNCIIVLKHVPVIITDGEEVFVTNAGNPGMASGGTGDVLTGLISGLLARGLQPIIAAALGSFIHASAGVLYVNEFSPETMTASVLLDYIPKVLANYYE